MRMPRTREQLEQAAADAEAWLDQLDPDTTPAEDATLLRRIGLALKDRVDDDRRIKEAVADARNHGHSWSEIAMVLGTSKQAASKNFRELADQGGPLLRADRRTVRRATAKKAPAKKTVAKKKVSAKKATYKAHGS